MLFLPKQHVHKHLKWTGSCKLKVKGPISRHTLSWVPRPHTPLAGVQHCIWTTFFWNFLDTRGYFGTSSRQCNLLTHRQKFCWKTALGYPLPPQNVAAEGLHTPQHGGAKLWAPRLCTTARLAGFWFFTTTSITNFLRQRNISMLARYIQCLNLHWQKNVLSSCSQNNVPPVHQGVTTEKNLKIVQHIFTVLFMHVI